MRICIPSADDRGLQGLISTHFGRAPYYTLVDGGPGAAASVVLNERAAHEHGQCSLPEPVTSYGVDAVICRGIGRNALVRLRARGIDVYLTDAERVADGLDAYRAGRLEQITDVEACRGGHHGEH